MPAASCLLGEMLEISGDIYYLGATWFTKWDIYDKGFITYLLGGWNTR